MQYPEDKSGGTGQRRVEAARYALLRRLALAMRHELVVHLQPIAMITEIMERRLVSPEPDLEQVHEGLTRINGFSRAAVQSCLDVVSWLAPEDGIVIALDAGVQECVALLRSDFTFRGFTLTSDVGEAPLAVARTGLRNVLPACLLALTDRAVSPCDIVLKARLAPDMAVLTVTLRPGQGRTGYAGEAPYRLLEWHEVEALASADGVGLARNGDEARLVFPRTP